MIIYDKILFVNTPRTASRTISEVLYKNKGLVIGQHHNEPLEALQTARANNLNIVTLTREPKEQNGKCALSGEELTCLLTKGSICKTNASIDRIVAGGPYTKDNIQLVCRALNSWRGDTDLMEFIEWCRKVVQYQDEEE